MKTKLIPFTKDALPAAGELLAERHVRNRKTLPVLPERFEQPDVAAKAIEALLEKKTASGYAAVRGGKMVAYLIGDHTVEPWGRCGWVRLPGSALAEGESVETLQDLYVLLGNDWVKRGVFIHHTYLSAADKDIVNAWFDLDFGKERIDAILDFAQVEIPEIRIPKGIRIRRAGPGDNEHLAGMSHIIFRELEKAPYWHPTPPEIWAELREGWGELADNENVDAWLAMDGGRTVATIASWKEAEDATAMLVGPQTFTFSVAATRPEYRGRGIGAALTWTCLAHGRGRGCEYCYTDWISPNLAASRFWPRFGFEEAAYRLTKHINPMIAWTRLQNS
jgi:ribosomal protein S18 acetylase RimI-like enzyme